MNLWLLVTHKMSSTEEGEAEEKGRKSRGKNGESLILRTEILLLPSGFGVIVRDKLAIKDYSTFRHY